MSKLRFEGLWLPWPQVQVRDFRVTVPVFSLTEPVSSLADKGVFSWQRQGRQQAGVPRAPAPHMPT